MKHLLTTVVVALAAAGSSACTPSSGATSTPEGAQLYASYCAMCHGNNGRGTNMNLAPSLAGTGQHWDEDSLIEYFVDPKAYAAGVERLGSRQMPALPPTLSSEQHRELARHALRLMK